MHSPKKESCTRFFLRGPGNSLAIDGRDRVSWPSLSAEELRARDRALPDRLVVASLICDCLVIVYAMIFAYWARFQTPLGDLGIKVQHSLQDYASYIALGSLAFILTLTACGIYERSVLLRFRFVSLQILKASVLWAAGFISLVLVLRFEPPISRIYIGCASVLTPAALLTWRWLLHRYLRRSAVATNLRQRILFVGWNDESENLSKHFTQDPNSAYEIVGCIGSMRAGFQRRPSVHVHGRLDELVDIIYRTGVDIVMLADVHGMKGDIIGLANTCEREMVQFKVIPSYFQILVSGLHLETVSGIPILGVSRLPLDKLSNILLKRFMDIIGALVGLAISLPLIAIFGLIVYRESPGPVIFRQRRITRRGMEFYMLKIRSMRLNAQAEGGWTVKDDPRRLKIGAFMRRFNIDEIPQFWNVLKGEMSLVGPRPELTETTRNLKHEIPHYNARHNANPGMTGWAQVSGFRGDTDLTERIKCDLWYLENWSPLLDIQIMFLTFFKRDNAY